ncbi:MAG: pitrilysin family protein [Polyangiales bacterium]
MSRRPAISAVHISKLRSGARVVVQTDKMLPIVEFCLAFDVGSHADPPGFDGLANLCAQSIRKGPEGMSAIAFGERLESLGAQLGVQVNARTTRFRLSVLRRNVDAAIDLLTEALQSPAVRPSDLSKLKRRLCANIASSIDDDQWIGLQQFMSTLYGAHPYARTVTGSVQSVRRIKQQTVLAFIRRHYSQSRLVFGAAGDIDHDEALALARRVSEGLPSRKIQTPKIPAVPAIKGRRVVIVDKADRTQTQLFIGGLGSRTRDRDLFALRVSNTAFGGSFSGRLMQAVRAERGWSYGAYSHLLHGEERAPWYMSTAPGIADTVDCIDLQLAMAEEWVQKGITQQELNASKQHLIESRVLDYDTALHQLGAQMDVALSILPESQVVDFESKTRAVTRKDANHATHSRIDPKGLVIVAVASADALLPRLEKLPGIASIEVATVA